MGVERHSEREHRACVLLGAQRELLDLRWDQVPALLGLRKMCTWSNAWNSHPNTQRSEFFERSYLEALHTLLM